VQEEIGFYITLFIIRKMVSTYFVLEQVVYHAAASGFGLATANNFANGKPGWGILTAVVGLGIEGYAIYNGIRHSRELQADSNRVELTDRVQ
jgi:hypothetical protein